MELGLAASRATATSVSVNVSFLFSTFRFFSPVDVWEQKKKMNYMEIAQFVQNDQWNLN